MNYLRRLKARFSARSKLLFVTIPLIFVHSKTHSAPEASSDASNKTSNSSSASQVIPNTATKTIPKTITETIPKKITKTADQPSDKDSTSVVPYSSIIAPELITSLIFKIVDMEQSLRVKNAINIHVVGNAKIAQLLDTKVGMRIGGSTLNSVNEGKAIPAMAPQIVFISQTKGFEAWLDYATKKNILIITDIKELVSKGAEVGIYDNDGIPGILLNLTRSNQQQLIWEASILDIAQIIETP